ncbi:nitric-oxide reductase large subunit [Corynebacterium sp. zg254]|uniref:Nitric-oxide reductase large subunit n=1 Tax=Corynebacterium zhongnanshanii TaxID=2768834 RepID=A0ABQ6VGS7_9CORY|nr:MULTISPECIES: cbb3-type cytochrome c oxidase subunit I [Corynebacterium]KAB3523616.1 nitric-oxide reductase large subunit [Corynebacterium zhongnanshanii]MCR5913965.1 nitric-oxide reductase large subunit [Corynebacterium sp. zg254]
MLVGRGWVQGVALVMLFGFFVMGLLTYRTYSDSMPLPDTVATESGETLFTHEDITRGQEIYLARGLQQYGSIVGHGAYLGPDYTAESLRLMTENVTSQLEKERTEAITKAEKSGDTQAIVDARTTDVSKAVADMFRTNRYNEETKTLVLTDEQVKAVAAVRKHYADYFGEPTTKYGLPPNFITDSKDIEDLTHFFTWTAWASAAERPGTNYSYTNNWPSEPRVENSPTADIVVWSVLSLIALIGGTGLIFAIYGRWSRKIGWHSEESPNLRFKQSGDVGLTGSQRAVAWFVVVIAVLFLGQSLLGGAIQHYRSDLTSFFGIDLAQILPYNLARTWHLQLSLFWTAAGFLAAGLFLTPFIAGKEPKGTTTLTYLLLGAVAIVVFGSLAFEALSTFGIVGEGTWLSQQWEYLDLPRLFQFLLIVGMFFWIIIIFRSLRSRLKGEHKSNMPWLFFYTGLAIPVFYAVGMMARGDSHLTVADFWRFWVVHLWVEDFLELFSTVMVAYIFVLLGVIRERIALGIIFLDIILYSTGGVLGTMHHLYFSGTPVEHMALGAFFSALEVVPLTLLTVEAWTFLQLGSRQRATGDNPFPHRWAVMFLVAVGFWNFLGAGIFGFLVNLPIVSYYQIGTALTANHAHAAMMGVYGFLAVAMSVFALRYILPPKYWSDKAMKWAFWLQNIGLLWMCFITLLPLGIAQLHHSVSEGYVEARSLGYLTQPGNSVLEWLRLPGDLIFIAGIVPFVWMAVKGLIHFRSSKLVDEMPEHPLYEELAPEEATEGDVLITNNRTTDQ